LSRESRWAKVTKGCGTGLKKRMRTAVLKERMRSAVL